MKPAKYESKIFLNCSPRDHSSARDIYDLLSLASPNVWFDKANLVPGAACIGEVEAVISSARPTVVLDRRENTSQSELLDLQMVLERGREASTLVMTRVVLLGAHRAEDQRGNGEHLRVDSRASHDFGGVLLLIARSLLGISHTGTHLVPLRRVADVLVTRGRFQQARQRFELVVEGMPWAYLLAVKEDNE